MQSDFATEPAVQCPMSTRSIESSCASSRRDRLCAARSPRRAGAAIAALLLGSTLLGACGSSASKATAAVEQACKRVEAVLSDGPEPAADPVGYAEAQILPLRQIRTPDGKLHEAIHGLATAYETFFADRGSGRAASSAVSAAVARVDAICPGAAS